MKSISFLVLRSLSTAQFWFTYRLTGAGKFAFTCLLISAAVGIDTDLTFAHQIFTLLAAVFVVSILSSLRFQLSCEVSRSLPQFVTVGEQFQYKLILKNNGENMREGLSLMEFQVSPVPSFTEYSKLVDESSGSKKGFIKIWRSYTEEKLNGESPLVRIPALRSDHAVEIVIDIIADHRGYIDFSRTVIFRVDPLGLYRAFHRISTPQTLLVLPKRYTLPEISLPGKRIYQHGGVTLAASKGDTEEFIGLRDYREGDPLQHIHWKSFARIGKPVVKEYQDEFFERHALVLDTFSKNGSENVFEEAVALAASFACTIETQENLLDLMFVGDQAYTYTAGVGQLHVDGLLEILAGVRALENGSFSELRTAVLERRASLSSCILILTAWDRVRQDFVDELNTHGLPLQVFTISEKRVDVEEQPMGVHLLDSSRIKEGLARI